MAIKRNLLYAFTVITFEFIVLRKSSVFDRAKDGSTLLHVAALHGHSETAMVLHKRGVPLLMPNRYQKLIAQLPYLNITQKQHSYLRASIFYVYFVATEPEPFT